MEYILLFIYLNLKELISHELGEGQKLKAVFGLKMPFELMSFQIRPNFSTAGEI